MEKLNLTINERFGIRNLLNEIYSKGGLTLETLNSSQKIIEEINIEIEFDKKPDKDGSFKAIKGDEAKAVNMRQVVSIVNGQRSGQLVWDAKVEKGKTFDFSKNKMDLLKEIITTKSEKKELKMEDNYLIGLSEKLGIEIKE